MGSAKGQGRITVVNLRAGTKLVLTHTELQALLKEEQAKDPTARMTAEAGKKYIVTNTSRLYQF